jgi:hypothetical protein
MQQTLDFISRCAAFFDQAVATASDDELFAQGYLRGHVDLAVGRLQLDEQPFSVAQIEQAVAESLQSAIALGELNDADAALVQQIWHQLTV